MLEKILKIFFLLIYYYVWTTEVPRICAFLCGHLCEINTKVHHVIILHNEETKFGI